MKRRRNRLNPDPLVEPTRKRERLSNSEIGDGGGVLKSSKALEGPPGASPIQAPVDSRGRPTTPKRKIPTRFTEAIELALTMHGMDGKGKNGLAGYFYHLAVVDPKAMAHLIGRILPTKLAHSVDPQSALGQVLDTVKARIAFERSKQINGTVIEQQRLK